VWFTEQKTNVIGYLDPSTNTFKEWVVPTPGSGVCEMAAYNGIAYFVEWSGDKVGRLNPSTNTFTEWKIPGYGIPGGAGIIVSGGIIWFTTDKLCSLNPQTNLFTPWTVPTPGFQPSAYGGKIWFTETMGNKIAKLYPTGGSSTYITPQTNVRSPKVTVKTPTSKIAYPSTTYVAPTVKDVPTYTTGNLAEWPIGPSGLGATSDPLDVSSPGGGEVWFNEDWGVKIGMLG